MIVGQFIESPIRKFQKKLQKPPECCAVPVIVDTVLNHHRRSARSEHRNGTSAFLVQMIETQRDFPHNLILHLRHYIQLSVTYFYQVISFYVIEWAFSCQILTFGFFDSGAASFAPF